MFDLPEMMNGRIALKYRRTVEAAWLASEEKHPHRHPHSDHEGCKTKVQGCPTHLVGCTGIVDCEASVEQIECTVCDETCSTDLPNCTQSPKKTESAFSPVVAGWLNPPAMPLR